MERKSNETVKMSDTATDGMRLPHSEGIWSDRSDQITKEFKLPS